MFILDIDVSITFQWYKKIFEAMNFDPCNRALKIRESICDSNSQNGSSLRSVRVHSLTLFTLPGACEVTPGSPSWPATFQPFALVASPRLGLRHNQFYYYNLINIQSAHKINSFWIAFEKIQLEFNLIQFKFNPFQLNCIQKSIQLLNWFQYWNLIEFESTNFNSIQFIWIQIPFKINLFHLN
jgi:hypothetical protein